MITSIRRFQVGDKVRIHGGLPWTVAADDTNKTPVRDPEPAYELTQTRTNSSRGYHYVYESVRYAYESELIPVA